MVKVGSELADVDLDLTGCIQLLTGRSSPRAASKKLDKAYAAFCSSIYWGIVRARAAVSARWDGGGLGQPHQTSRQLRPCWLLSQANTEAPNLLRMRPVA